MKEFVALIKTRLNIFILLIILFLLALAFIKSSKNHVVNHIEPYIYKGHESESEEYMKKTAMNQSVMNRNRKDDLKISYTVIDQKKTGALCCVCPLCRITYIHSTNCLSKCPKCHKDLMRGIYAGEGYLSRPVQEKPADRTSNKL